MRNIFISILFSVMLIVGCNPHFISDEAYREMLASDLEMRDEVLDSAGIDFESMDVSPDAKEALQFLYAYMPLGDIVNHPVEYYLDHYRMTLKALD